ncbi:histidine phosphatase family protein [Bradyrhizobium sp. ISRA442]|uniref:histidine phosphatase family protein n=1 Tax=Bradyrhizobium sp. ISRA442 TaxID=2866197 RepID=UPI00311B2477
MTTFSLIRHGTHDAVGRMLVGRMADIRLNACGRNQAQRIADWLCGEQIVAVQSSPQLRSRETVEPLARRLGLSIELVAAIDELNVGEWTGRSFASLGRDPLWSSWNTRRGATRPPNGESMLELQARTLDHLNRIATWLPHGHVALCSHAEVIRAVVLHALKLSLDDYHRVEIAPATISTLEVDRRAIAVVALNQSVAS